jgi:hypothetical protein
LKDCNEIAEAPILFSELMSAWMMMPDLVNLGVKKGYVVRSPTAPMTIS